ncbi:MAG: aldo/keto reductase [Kiritimatiellae bacterium]|nr:aldo/keto reductase [Kiritimatiellia bacterium]
MQYRTLGRTGLKVSSLGLGTVELGQDWGIEVPDEFGMPSEKSALALMRRAVELGINFFDTARYYGKSEERIGKFLASIGSDASNVYIATKVPAGGKGTTDEVKKHIEKVLDKCLQALGRETIDVVQLHSANLETITNGIGLEVLSKARDTGKIRFIGATFYDPEAARAAVESSDYDTIQPTYNLAMPQAREVIDLAHESNIGVIVKSPLNKGTFSYKRTHLSDTLKGTQVAGDALAFLECDGQTFPQAAIRYCLERPGVSTVIAGTQQIGHLEENALSVDRTLTDKEVTRIVELQNSGAFKNVDIP